MINMESIDIAWTFLKALPEQQMNYENTGDRHGTVHPAIAGLLEREGYGASEGGFEVPDVEAMDKFGDTVRGPNPIENLPGSANWRYPTREPAESQKDFKGRQKDVRGAYLDPDEEDRQRAQQAHDRDYGFVFDEKSRLPSVDDYMPGGREQDRTKPRTPELYSIPNVPYTDPRHEIHGGPRW